MLLFIVYSRGH